MSRTAVFHEFNDVTKTKWENIAKAVSDYANIEADYNPDQLWTKDEMVEFMIVVMQDRGESVVERMIDTYFERMTMASVFNGIEKPSLDLVKSPEGGCAYKWLRNKEIPAGMLNHLLAIVGGMPRKCYDYFVIMGKEFRIEELVDAIGAHKCMTLLLLAELFIRVEKVSNTDEDQFQSYINLIHKFKEDIQSRITQDEITQFNKMMSNLLLTTGE